MNVRVIYFSFFFSFFSINRSHHHHHHHEEDHRQTLAVPLLACHPAVLGRGREERCEEDWEWHRWGFSLVGRNFMRTFMLFYLFWVAVQCGVAFKERKDMQKKTKTKTSSICHNTVGWLCKVSLVRENKCCENKYLKWGETEVVHTCVAFFPSYLNVYLKENDWVLKKEFRLRILIFTILMR